jgi:hypothetical protein
MSTGVSEEHACYLLHVGVLLGLFFGSEDGCYITGDNAS